MLDGLFGRGFTSKCKSLMKHIGTRIDLIRKRRNAMQTNLKKDIAELLAKGLDDIAYGRAEALLVDLNKSSCYDLVEQFCVCISKHLSVMQRQRECPEECKEAVPSLMFAAARFADLSELRELRKIFAERYGNSLESFENQEFVEKLTPKPPTMDKKLQLLRDIAQEFSIRWDSQAFAQKMSNTLASTQDRSRKQESFQGSNGGYKYHNGTEDSVPKRENWDVSSKGRQELTDDGYEPRSNMKDTFSRKDNQDLSSRGRREVADDEYKPKRNNLDNSSHGGRECFNDEYKLRKDTCPEKNNEGISSHERPEATPSYTTRQKMKADYKDNSVANSINKIVEDDTESIKPFYNNVIPPPYVKPRGRNHRTNSEALHTSYDYNEAPLDPPSHSRDVAKNRSNKTRTSSDYVDDNRQVVGATRVDGHGDEKDYHDQDDLIVGKRKPRSVRRKPKPSPGHDNTGNFDRDEVVKRNPNHRRREDARQDQILCNDVPKDEQEKIMDELLIQNSKKPSTYEPGKVRTGLKAPPSHHTDADTGKSPHSRSTDKAHLNSVLTHTPARAVSLPPEPTTPTEMARGPARASSFQPESLNPVAHVHPKLPEYDVLAAHFAALRGR